MLSFSLNNIRVLDLTRILAGPWCTQNLAELGAEVIKVERPVSGDDSRQWGPSYIKKPSSGMSTYFSSCNRGKHSVTANFKDPEDLKTLRELAKQVDIFIENYKPGTLEKYGLGYEELKKINPQLIYISISAYGQYGPKARQPGYDYVFQGVGGLMSYTGIADNEAGAGPIRVGVAVIDLMTGMYATTAALAALQKRAQTQKGCYIDLSLLDVAVAMHANLGSEFLNTGNLPIRSGNKHSNCAPYDVFSTLDGHFILAIGNDTQFECLRSILNNEELNQSKFNKNLDRLNNRDELKEILKPILKTKTTQEWGVLLNEQNIPWGPINTLNDVMNDPQVQFRKIVQKTQHDQLGIIYHLKNPLLSAHGKTQSPPMLGQHNHLYGFNTQD
ncbi:MAG TPA: CoA transferase [Paenalcaligenes sp.]|nr:CoA transferase [Paenalcaligenes sp.]